MKKPICKMITFDSSTKVTGYAVFENGILKRHGEFDISNIQLMDNRFPVMVRSITDLLNKENPDIIYVEELKVERNAKTARFLSKLIGTIYGWAIAKNVEFNEWPPTVTRKHLGFQQGKNVKRESLKEQAIAYVKRVHQIDVLEDRAEAICLGDAVIVFFQELEKMEEKKMRIS